jgi:CRP/FNR family transcriptional regulator
MVSTGVTEIPSCAAGVPFLRALPAEALTQLGRAMRHRRYERGEWVAGQGDPIDDLVVVASGRLKAVRGTAGGREQVVRTIEPGEFLGELALFAPATHEGDLIAVEPSDVCLLSRQAVEALLREHPEAAVGLVEALAQRLADAERWIADLGLRDVGQRLAAELLRASASGTRAREGIRVRMETPWVEVAARLGTTPESLSRRLRAMAAAGMIRQEGARTVVILSPERLRRLAEA